MKSLEFDIHAVDDLLWWSINDKRLVPKILKLVIELEKHPFEGLGKPEPLKGNLQGLWSRRINDEHRLVYEVLKDKIRILACRFHYDT